jgi:gliding motility-associated-like protein
MKKVTIYKRLSFAVLTLLFALNSYAQLPDFTITATTNPAACGGTGSLTITATGADPAATITYSVFLLPNVTVPVSVGTAATVTSLAAGNYQIIATQSLGAASNTSPPITVSIQSLVIPTIYTATPTAALCGSDGKINVDVLEGNGPFTYELYAGTSSTNPIVTAQTSNVFNNLAAGNYTVRVIDACGAFFNKFVQVLQSPSGITISSGDVLGGILPSCNTITINHFFSGTASSTIAYPITFTITVNNPNGGAPTVVTQTVTSGTSTNNILEANIPFYNNQSYTYSISVTDACGRTSTRANNLVNTKFEVTQQFDNQSCNDNVLMYAVDKFVPPYTVSFPTAPAGFNPQAANPLHPTFSSTHIQYQGDERVPEGTYVATFTDACGHTFTTPPMVVEYPDVVDVVIVAGAECGATTGSIRAVIEIELRTITRVVITDRPGHTNVPQDVSQFIDPNPITGFLMEGLPLGMYTLSITDSCGETYIREANIVPSGGSLSLAPLFRYGCEEGVGSIRLGVAPTPQLTSVRITRAPEGFDQELLPLDVTSNIASNGHFYMNSLPEGSYRFEVIGGPCNATAVQDIVVQGYHVTRNEITITPFCGSFNVNIDHESNGSYSQSFWLQKYNSETGTWGHPLTGAPYVEGAQPQLTNAVLLNNGMNIGQQFEGQLRVIKVFFTYSNGLSTNSRCVQVLHTFTFGGPPVILEVVGFPCSNGNSETVVVATGVAPLKYKIVKKNDQDFIVDNGTSNIFADLAVGRYIVEVTDNCNNSQPHTFEVNTSESLEINKEGFCEGEASQLSVTNFPFLRYEWYKEGAPGTILSTTYFLDFPAYNSVTQSGEYTVRIIAADPESCMNGEVSTTLNPNNLPRAGEDNTVPPICNDGTPLDLNSFLSAIHDGNGTWADVDASGGLTGTTFNTSGLAPGTYHFTYTVTGDCNSSDEAIITLELRERPDAPVIPTIAPVCEGDIIQLSGTSTTADVLYQWSGPNNFASTDQNPVIAAATVNANGMYSLVVTKGGCASAPVQLNVVVNPLPVFTLEGNTAICAGQSTRIDVVSENFDEATATYRWYHDGVLQTDLTAANILAFETGEYKVEVINNNCLSVPQLLSVVENTNAFDILLEDGCRDFEYVISVTNTEDLGFTDEAYRWSGPNNFSNTGHEVVITDLTPGEYSVTAANADGCSTTARVTVLNTSCRIPKGVSPNNDEYNNNFDLSNLDVMELKIYNRYGIEVYTKQNYEDEWYGQSDKGDLPTGTYYYVVSLSTGKQVSGWVYLQKEIN